MLRRNKEAWGMDVTQRKFYKYKKEKKKCLSAQEKNEYNEKGFKNFKGLYCFKMLMLHIHSH